MDVTYVSSKVFYCSHLLPLFLVSYKTRFIVFLQIYLAGFTTSVRDKLNRILNVGGATRLDDISDAVTHVIVGDENKASAELKPIISRGLR